MFWRVIKYLIELSLVFSIFIGIALAFVGVYFFNRWTKDLPKIERISDYEPKAVTTIVADDGTPIARLFDEFRLPVTFEEIPPKLRMAFLAAEDANFYKHSGVDLTSIGRAALKNFLRKLGFTKFSAQGGSTITQQTVKSLLLTRDKTIERKVKEAVLAYRIENSLTKDEILTIYLNEIFLGLNSYGVKAAAWMHFRKELKDLNLMEMAYLAGLPPRPSHLSDPRNKKDVEVRIAYVLDQMLKRHMLTSQEVTEALKQPIKVYTADLSTVLDVPYYSTFAMTELEEKLRIINPSITSINPGGYTIYTEVNISAQKKAEQAVKRGLRSIDKRRGWRGPLVKVTSDELEKINIVNLKSDEVYKAIITEIKGKKLKVRVGDFVGVVDLENKANSWAKKFLTDNDETTDILPESILKSGQIIEVSLPSSNDQNPIEFSDITKEVNLNLDQTPEVEAALVLLNPLTGAVKAVVGGYDFERSRFNRATQGLRQPGSTFKPIVYTAAIDFLGYTPSTIVPDKPISIITDSGDVWEPKNFERRFDGDITLRTALQKSKNAVAAYLIQQVGVEKVVNLAKKFGLTTPIGRNPSISLGAAEIKLLELVSVYGVFPSGGNLAQRIVISKIVDRNGQVIYEQKPKLEKVLSEETAFIMTNLLRGVIQYGTGRRVNQLGVPVAGKTGTANNQTDTCFVGFTPEWVAGVWVGFDTKREIGQDDMAAASVTAPLFLEFMKNFLAGKEPVDFAIPDGVVPVPVDINTGLYSDDHNAFIDYFKKGTEPIAGAVDTRISKDYLTSDDF